MMIEERINPGQMGLFPAALGGASPLDRAYTARGDKIAFREGEDVDEDRDDRVYPEER